MEAERENKVVQLCAQGMEAEGTDNEKALRLFRQAWDSATNDFEALIAAHYLARHQKRPEDTLKWNLEALHRAMCHEKEEVRHYLPSLYLNVGKSYEDLGDVLRAEEAYRLGAACAEHLPQDGYGAMIRRGIERGLLRVDNRRSGV